MENIAEKHALFIIQMQSLLSSFISIDSIHINKLKRRVKYCLIYNLALGFILALVLSFFDRKLELSLINDNQEEITNHRITKNIFTV